QPVVSAQSAGMDPRYRGAVLSYRAAVDPVDAVADVVDFGGLRGGFYNRPLCRLSVSAAAPSLRSSPSCHDGISIPLVFCHWRGGRERKMAPKRTGRLGGFDPYRRGAGVVCRYATSGFGHRRRSSGTALSPVQRGRERRGGSRPCAVGHVYDAAIG